MVPPGVVVGARAARARLRGERPEWEWIPQGWSRQDEDERIRGWDVDTVADAYRSKWPAFARAVDGDRPLGVAHEVHVGAEVRTEDPVLHNTLVSFAYVAALAAQDRRRLSVLDWGGGLAHYYLVAKSVLPGTELDYTCKEVPAVARAGAELVPDVRFSSDEEACLARSYDLVFASGSLHYSRDWRRAVRGLAGAVDGYLYLTRLPVALTSEAFVVLQRAYAYGYATEYLGWVLNREELLDEAASAGMELAREFLLLEGFGVRGAPEEHVGYRGFLFGKAGASRIRRNEAVTE